MNRHSYVVLVSFYIDNRVVGKYSYKLYMPAKLCYTLKVNKKGASERSLIYVVISQLYITWARIAERADRVGRGLVRGEAGSLFWKYLQGQVLWAIAYGAIVITPPSH